MVSGSRMVDILLLLTTIDTTETYVSPFLDLSPSVSEKPQHNLFSSGTRGFAHAWTRHSTFTVVWLLSLCRSCFTDCNVLVSKSNRKDKSNHKDSFLLVLLSKFFWIVTEQRILFKAHHVWVSFCPEYSGYRTRGYDRELVLPNFRDFQYFQANETIKCSCQSDNLNRNFHAWQHIIKYFM